MKGRRLHWFTSDLRVDDNPALAAGGDDAVVAGVFVFDPASLRRAAGASRRVALLHACLAALDRRLADAGSRLLTCTGDPAELLPRVAARLGVRLVSHARNYEPAARAREERVARALGRDGIEVAAADAALVHPPGTLATAAGSPYLVYGAFARAWTALRLPAPVAAPTRWMPAAEIERIEATPPSSPPRVALPEAGEEAAAARLAAFVRDGLEGYAERRDLPGVDGTSRLSYHLRFGVLSAAQAARRVRAAADRTAARRHGAGVWLRELAWRDFFAHVLHAFPRVAREPMRALPIRWRLDDDGLRRWQEGRTGYPIVDAGMRQLAASGWMHNRARLITASFLARHLLVDWREGERHFMALLLDGQLAQNDGNWQWVAGTGTDAQPPFRIFSPVRQGERFDPDGAYVRRWVPELARVPAARVHQPWTLTAMERRARCPDYPPPVVDPDTARGRALAAIEDAIRRRAAGERLSMARRRR
jgi:deoxyribodipyrimidine photo-lyase